MLQVSLDSKTQLGSCDISPKYLLGLYTLEDICVIDAFILCDSFFLYSCLIIYLFSRLVHISFWLFRIPANSFTEFYGFENSAIHWSSNPHLKHIFGILFLSPVNLFLGLHELKNELILLLPFTFICCLKHFSVGCGTPKLLNFEWENFPFSVALTEASKCT